MPVSRSQHQPAYPGRLGEMLDTLALATDTMMRGEMLVDLADQFREVPPEIARRPFPHAHQIRACESEAYIWGVLQPDRTLKLYFAVENPSGISAKAVAVILDRALSGLGPADVFRTNISMGKGLGLMSMVRAVQTIASQAARHLEPGGALPVVFPRSR
jgi:cysteine desulfuration protein SufE